MHDNNHHISSATDFVGDNLEIDVIFYLLEEKLEKELPETSFVTHSRIIYI